MPAPVRRRVVLIGLYAVCLAAAGAIARPLVSPDAAPTPAKLQLPADADDPLFTPVFLPPGTWTSTTGEFDPELAAIVREKGGGGTLLDTRPAASLDHLPVPAGVSPQAVRVDADGRASAVLTTPTNPDAATAAWAAAGWAATDRRLGDGRRVVRLTRGGVTAVAWALPVGPTSPDVRFLIALTGGHPR
jgi:hypothetical protein